MLEWVGGAVAGAAALGLSLRYNWWRSSRPGVPLLMYHHITDQLNGTGLAKLRVAPKSFARQLDWLIDHEYEAVTMSRALSANPPAKPVVLTFDDGYANFYDEAWPLLRERGMQAMVFLVTGQLDGMNNWDKEKGEPLEDLLSRAQVRELSAQGVEFGGHSHNHCDLTALDDRKLMREITGCQKVLTDLLGRPARSFSYPYGLFNQRVQEATVRAGFTMACTTRPGKVVDSTDRLKLPRIIVKRSDNMLDFRLKMSRTRSRV
jgi:peptidoglycan/xylan/chitin deacetylase (PgdA/CDA1 family)